MSHSKQCVFLTYVESAGAADKEIPEGAGAVVHPNMQAWRDWGVPHRTCLLASPE